MKYNFIHASNICNAQCWFCMQDSLPYRSSSMVNFLNPDLLDLSVLPKNIETLEITGLGEPTLNPDIEQIVFKVSSFCRKNGIVSSGYTNGANLKAYRLLQDVNISMHSIYEDKRKNIFNTVPLTRSEIELFLEISTANTIQFHFILAKNKGIETRQDVFEAIIWCDSFRDKRVKAKFRALRDSTKGILEDQYMPMPEWIPNEYRELSKGCDKYPVIATNGRYYEDWSMNREVSKCDFISYNR